MGFALQDLGILLLFLLPLAQARTVEASLPRWGLTVYIRILFVRAPACVRIRKMKKKNNKFCVYLNFLLFFHHFMRAHEVEIETMVIGKFSRTRIGWSNFRRGSFFVTKLETICILYEPWNFSHKSFEND